MDNVTISAILSASISGVLAFTGAAFGVRYQRKTQRESWLLQKRSETFTEFWHALETFQNILTDLNESVAPHYKIQMERMKAAEFINTKLNIVRFYLDEKDRVLFSECVDKYINFDYSAVTLNDLPLDYPPSSYLDKIQNMFETYLSK